MLYSVQVSDQPTMSKVGNQTNSQDPQAVNSRTFVGNLNTFQCTKTDVERMFQRYGKIAGISMHKGYAFVQFTNPFDARSACMGEDGRNVFGQILDVNLVAEPKPHQIGRKRPNVAKAAADWEQFYDSYNAGALAQSAAAAASGARLTPPLKRPRLIVPSVRQQQQRAQSPKKVVVTTPGADDLRTYSSPDILICGNCRELFSNLSDFLDHRKQYCKLRFTCKCSSFNGTMKGDESAALMCALCKENFASAWDLMVHAQAAHMVNIYQLSTKDGSQPESNPGSTVGSEDNNDLAGDSGSNPIPECSQVGSNNGLKENGLSETDNCIEMVNGTTGSSPVSQANLSLPVE